MDKGEYFHLRKTDLKKIAKEILTQLDKLQTRCGYNHQIAEDEIARIILNNKKKFGE